MVSHQPQLLGGLGEGVTHNVTILARYGNVCVYLQVKFMKSVPGTALVEMGDEYAVDRAITHLNSIKVFGKRLNVW